MTVSIRTRHGEPRLRPPGKVHAVIGASLIAAASYHPKPPAEQTPWDTLYVAAGMIVIILVVALAAAWMNAREARRS